MNFNLGDSYTLISKECAPDDFELTTDLGGFDGENIYAFVSGDYRTNPLPLRKNQRNYIMTGRGDTFANVSSR